MDVDTFITEMEVRLGKVYTDEQREFIKDITTPCFVFASPGTGKTQSAVGALITAELYHRILGSQIYALSFTNKATSELEVRHKKACERIGIKQTVNFKTLHKLCTDILKKYYTYLGMDELSIEESLSIEKTHDLILGTAEEKGWSVNPDKVKDIIRAIRTLNSSLVFDEYHVINSIEFKNCSIEYSVFTQIRGMLYNFNKALNKIAVEDILLYTLELLSNHPEVEAEVKSQSRIILVDEAQDLSLLQLGLVNRLSQTPVLIGDPKQQIYGFQGACPEVKREYFKMHPEARDLKLTKSFRCKDNIAKAATPTILKNKLGGEDFTGCGEGGEVFLVPGMDVNSICKDLRNEYVSNSNNFKNDVLFLYRNNYSAIPLIESLYKHEVPFRTYKYPGAQNMPYIKELCQIIDFVRTPHTPGLDLALGYIIPEFRGYVAQTPLMKVANKLQVSPLSVNYSFRNPASSIAMQCLLEVDELLKKGAPVGDVFNQLWDIFYKMYARNRERYTDRPALYYINLVNPVIKGKTYDQFIHDECEKFKLIDYYEKYRIGVRCYTIHSAKGLEADIVHLIDADEGIIPNSKTVEQMVKKHCLYDASKHIRNERSLVYVAMTRAKESLYIYHSSDTKLSPLITGDDPYGPLDVLYESMQSEYADTDAFLKFTKGDY